MSYWNVFLNWGTYCWSSCLYHAICKNNRNCLILDASFGSCNCPNCQKESGSWLFVSDCYILLDIFFCNCNITYALWVLVSEKWVFVSEKAISKIFTLPLLHICIQREKDQCCVLFVGIFCAGMPGSNLGSCQCQARELDSQLLLSA